MLYRPTRRSALIATGAAAALAGCGKSVTGLDPARRVLDIANAGEPLTLDPQKASGTWENNIIGNLFLGLTTEAANGEIIGGMAERWETSADGLVWTFYLRPATWSDGVACTAYDFVYAYQNLFDPDTIAEYAFIMYPIKNGQARKEGKVGADAVGAKALDERTLQLTLEYPAPYLPGILKHYSSFAIPRHIHARVGGAWVKPENIATNGAFTLVRHWSNYIVALKKNPRFYDAANVAFEELYFYPVTNDDSAARRVMRGEVGWSTNFPGKKRDYYDKVLPNFPRVAPYLLNQHLNFNTQRKPFDDPRVRRALTMAIDRDFLCNSIWKAGYQPSYNLVPPGMAGYDKAARWTWADMTLDQRRAEGRRLLMEAGFGPGKPLRFEFIHRNTGDNPEIARVIQSDWRDLGQSEGGGAPWVEATLRGGDVQIHYATMRSKNYEVGDGGWVGDFNDPRTYLSLAMTATGPQNYSGYSSLAFDTLMDQSDRELDPAKRSELLRQAEQMMLEDCPMSPLGFGASKNLVDPRITGWETNVEDIHRARWFKLKG
jgi:oligopeptide transport system substrate-binding protein